MAEFFLGGTVDPASHERTGDEIRIDSDKLTTHGVIVGMTGSGKTGLGVVLLEEVLGAGLPALIIDPKGDLTNLCLTFPTLDGASFRPWIDAAQAKAANATPDEFAAQQAELWTQGLLGWGITSASIAALRSTTDFTIYTPGSQSGVPLNIVGSLDAPDDLTDAELVGDEIEGYVTGLLALVGVDADPLSSREHILLSNLISHAWSQGQHLDLAGLVGMVGNPPIRKLGVFELDQFFPPKDRMKLALQLNGLLASPAFAAWADGPALDIDSMLYTPDGKGRAAIITTAHLSDEERQFVTSLILAKLVTWMRRQSGTTDLRALLYMDEVAGYLPPTANPPTKKPIMTLMKQARAFGIGVVVSTQNPVDIDYKALSNAGTWMIGRLSTERDKARLLDGLTSAAGSIDTSAVDDTISGLAKREFVLRQPGKDTVSVFTTRWAMSYLRGPMTRDQIAELMADEREAATAASPAQPSPAQTTSPSTSAATTGSSTSSAPALSDNETAVMPEVADGIPVRWVDVAAPWLDEVDGDRQGTRWSPAIVARVRLRFDETKADLVHDDEYECVIHPLDERIDVTRAIPVDYDDRDLIDRVPDHAIYEMPEAKIANKTFFRDVERDLKDHLYRSRTITIGANKALKLYARPGEDTEAFELRCRRAADEAADAEIAKLRHTTESKVNRLRDQIATAEDRVDVLEQDAASKRNSELLSTAGSILGGLLGGKSRRGMLGSLGTASRRRGTTQTAKKRVDAAENKVERLHQKLLDLEADLADQVTEIDARWMGIATEITELDIPLEKGDIDIQEIVLAWIPVS
ncbi:MAG: ATP-binding protein [Ilumatobacter coccineus]|uniref:ATP-binding protein n=1 Tax=Ilumatobacter coccineus TaxID=467094 RepID=A0A2G6KEK9_9ACTN|nr:MAG: ATP-binding protein [Ilumatobacter coccineus]